MKSKIRIIIKERVHLIYNMAAEIKAQFEGKWKIYKQENYEAYLDASGKFFSLFSNFDTRLHS